MQWIVRSAIVALCGLVVHHSSARADSIPIDAFLAGPHILDVAVSPDGRYVSELMSMQGQRGVVVIDVKSRTSKAVLSGLAQKRINPTWCGWANNTRLLCGYRWVNVELGQFYPVTRLVGVNADGSDMKVLYQRQGFRPEERSAQFQDQIIDWTPDDPDTVLMEIDSDVDTYPSVFAVNVYNGQRKTVVTQHAAIRHFVTDGHGKVRLGWGYKTGDTQMSFFAKLDEEKDWRLLSKVDVFSRDTVFRPVAAMPDSNFAYAIKSDGDLQALWKIDLEDKHDPEIVFEHPAVDVGDPLFLPTHRLLGVSYQNDRPAIFYTDNLLHAYIEAVDKLLPNAFNEIIDCTRDESTFVIRSQSDVSAPAYYLMTRQGDTLQLSPLGSSFPGLASYRLAPMRSISYSAKDGTRIPGYLTVPVGARPEKLPLIVLPHGGPIYRDVWGFDDLLQFLVSRGYAVLQMNFRGSSGYGDKWYWSAHQDWGGLTYSDIADGARWAVAQGIADPQRVCIVGWSFGGYAALLGATRDSQLYRCAASIAGVSDLPELLVDARNFVNYAVAREQLGTDSAKLKADSPRRHAGDINIPVLMIHGSHDYTVPVEHTYMMESALKKAGKHYKTVIIKEADHDLPDESDRKTLYAELDAFLKKELGPGVQ